MLSPIENYFESKPEPQKSCLLALRSIVLCMDDLVTESWKYAAPFYSYRGRMFCYLYLNKKSPDPYFGIVEGHRIEHQLLVKGDRKRMKVLPVTVSEDIDDESIKSILNQALDFYRNGLIKTKF